ncbi:hypothetical protein GMLC_10590 [Geomonas limicola]|uniref:Uncharacterized protein n=1 Tax=Geomonas limicola TaxID=2740186 RepID=A0A6V8N523_9BACT|nr:hypothetical protein [Geomonas limicola]GFO67480.1 hypothetical protein GMLC_10590 [Geomonas limicola]
MSRSIRRLRLEEIDHFDPCQWGERYLFHGMKNGQIRILTGGQFAGGDPEGTHPVFILHKIEHDCFKFCPCSSKNYNSGIASYIRRNSVTPPCKPPTDRDSYLLHFYSFNIYLSDRVVDRLQLRGVVSEEDIVGTHHKRGGSL